MYNVLKYSKTLWENGDISIYRYRTGTGNKFNLIMRMTVIKKPNRRSGSWSNFKSAISWPKKCVNWMKYLPLVREDNVSRMFNLKLKELQLVFLILRMNLTLDLIQILSGTKIGIKSKIRKNSNYSEDSWHNYILVTSICQFWPPEEVVQISTDLKSVWPSYGSLSIWSWAWSSFSVFCEHGAWRNHLICMRCWLQSCIPFPEILQ